MADTDNFIQALQGNRGMDFVDRILRPEKYATILNPDGSYSTHLMSSTGNVAYPNIVRKPGMDALTNLSPDEAYEYAQQSGQAITFPTEGMADQFASGGYKDAANIMRLKTSAAPQGAYPTTPPPQNQGGS